MKKEKDRFQFEYVEKKGVSIIEIVIREDKKLVYPYQLTVLYNGYQVYKTYRKLLTSAQCFARKLQDKKHLDRNIGENLKRVKEKIKKEEK